MRTDTKEYFQNIADGIQTATGTEVALEALAAIAELEEEAQKLRDAQMHSVQVSNLAGNPQ